MVDFIDEENISAPNPFFLGILGSRTDATMEILIDKILNPILSEVGRVPERIILPAEGESSIWIADWADRLHIPNMSYEADWHRHQRRAKIFRDSRIQAEATHFIVFLNKRSEFNEKMALRLARKGKTVYTVAHGVWDLEELVLSSENPPSSKLPFARPEVLGCKPSTGSGNIEGNQLPSQQ